MNKKKLADLVVLIWILFCFLIIPSCAPQKVKTADNVILITLDTTRADRLRCYGYDKIETPNLDLLASEGILFTNALCQVPITLPSHISILTGLYPPEHGVRHNFGYFLSEEVTTLTEILKGEGYTTGAAVSSYTVSKKWGIAQGFDSFYDTFAREEEVSTFAPKPDIRADETISKSIDWLSRNSDRKLFFWLHLYDPHIEYDPPPPFSEIYKDDLYDGEIAFMDSELGRLWDFLKKKDLWDDSLIIVIGDHGEGLNEHSESTHGNLIYETTMRIPLIIKGRDLPENIEVPEVSTTVDILPTVLDYLKLSIPPELLGMSLLKFIRNTSSHPERDIYLETLGPQAAFGWSELRGLRKGQWKYIDAPKPELYDLSQDAQELLNLVDEESERTEEMAENLRRLTEQLEATSKKYSQQIRINKESRDALLSLGYLSGTISQKGKGSNKDPKDYIFLQAHFEECSKALAAKDYKKTFEICNLIFKTDPENKAAGLLIAKALMGMGRPDQAIHQLDKLLGVYEDDIYAYEFLIDLYLGREMYREAERKITEALSYHPDYFYFNYALGFSYYGQKKINESIEALEKAISLNPWDYFSYILLAGCYRDQGMEPKAKECIKKAQSLGFHQKLKFPNPLLKEIAQSIR